VFAESGDHIVARSLSAAANLGGWFLSQHARTPLDKTILQGKQVRRAQRHLRVGMRAGAGMRHGGVVDGDLHRSIGERTSSE
jgi:hypothetical protein